MEFVLSVDSSQVSMDPGEFDAKLEEAEGKLESKNQSASLVPAPGCAICKEEPTIIYDSSDSSNLKRSSPAEDQDGNTLRHIVNTTILKGSLGIGLDLSVCPDTGRAIIRRYKKMPPGVINPASKCCPPIEFGDTIIAVNGQACPHLNDVVSLIKACHDEVALTLERK